MGIFKKKNREVISHADYNVIFDNKTVEGAPIETVEIGTLKVTTGKIIVCDPLAIPDMDPLDKVIPPGDYPIKLYFANDEALFGRRNAVAKLEFSPKRADKWVLALKEGEDVSKLEGNGDFFGFPVDAGLGGFMDEAALAEYNIFMDDFYSKNPEGNLYDDFFDAEFKKSAKTANEEDRGDWVNFQLPGTELNITMFSSGFGDGMYPAYWGMTNDNEIVSLVIDFHVLLLPEEEDEK